MKLPLLFSEAFEVPIWEMHQNDNFLLVSTRNDDKLEVAHHLFDLNSKTFLWRDVVFEELWWIGVTHFHDGIIVFHTFQSSENFERKSIFGFDVEKMEVLWSFEGFQPMQTDESKIYCTKKEEESLSYWELDIITGLSIELNNAPIKANKKDSPSISIAQNYPFHYVEGSAAFETVARFLKLKLGAKLVGACDYSEHCAKVIVSFFEETKTGLKNQLTIFDEQGENIYDEVLETGLKGLAADTFFIHGEALIFVKNRSHLTGLLIGN